MAPESPSVIRLPWTRFLFFFLALAVSMAAATLVMLHKVSLLGLSFPISLALHGALAWLFGRYEHAWWWIAAPLLLLGDALFPWPWSVAVHGGSPAGLLDYARGLLLDWTPWKLMLLLAALTGSWLGARFGRRPVAGAAA